MLIGDDDRFFDAVEVWAESRERPIVTVLDSPLLPFDPTLAWLPSGSEWVSHPSARD